MPTCTEPKCIDPAAFAYRWPWQTTGDGERVCAAHAPLVRQRAQNLAVDGFLLTPLAPASSAPPESPALQDLLREYRQINETQAARMRGLERDLEETRRLLASAKARNEELTDTIATLQAAADAEAATLQAAADAEAATLQAAADAEATSVVEGPLTT